MDDLRQPADEPTDADPPLEGSPSEIIDQLRDALGAAGHGWRVAQEAVDREVAEHRRSNERLNEEIARLGVAREQLRKRMAAEAEKLRASRDEWKAIAAECKAGTFTVTDGTLDDWVAAMRRGNDIVFSHARAAGLADESERLRALVGGRSAAPTRDEVGQRLTDAQQHNETLKGERDEARAAVVEAREILDALIEWFGAPDWAGPDLPVELGRRIATLLGPRSAVNRVRAPWALLSRPTEPPGPDGLSRSIDDGWDAAVARSGGVAAEPNKEAEFKQGDRVRHRDGDAEWTLVRPSEDVSHVTGQWLVECSSPTATNPVTTWIVPSDPEWVRVAAEPNAEYEALRAAERGFIVAPWTDRQVEALNTWQRERPVHPFTCGKRDDHESEGVLTATREGWVCEEPDCDYAQDWAHDFMAMTAVVAAEPKEEHDDG